MKTLLSFSLVGSIGFVIDLCVLLMLSSVLGPHFARPLSFMCAVSATYVLNKKITFRHTGTSKFWTYLGGQTTGFLLNFAVYEMVLLWLNTAYNLYAAFFMGSIAGLIFNFLHAKYRVFKHEKTPE